MAKKRAVIPGDLPPLAWDEVGRCLLWPFLVRVVARRFDHSLRSYLEGVFASVVCAAIRRFLPRSRGVVARRIFN